MYRQQNLKTLPPEMPIEYVMHCTIYCIGRVRVQKEYIFNLNHLSRCEGGTPGGVWSSSAGCGSAGLVNDGHLFSLPALGEGFHHRAEVAPELLPHLLRVFLQV